jgi:hypothetical protein
MNTFDVGKTMKVSKYIRLSTSVYVEVRSSSYYLEDQNASYKMDMYTDDYTWLLLWVVFFLLYAQRTHFQMMMMKTLVSEMPKP